MQIPGGDHEPGGIALQKLDFGCLITRVSIVIFPKDNCSLSLNLTFITKCSLLCNVASVLLDAVHLLVMLCVEFVT